MAAKYEAGQLWVSGGDWFFVTQNEGKFVCIVDSDNPGSVTEYVATDVDELFAGHTLSNPRGLREAAETIVKKWDSETEEWSTAKAVNMLRTALEGSGDGR